MKNNKKIGNYQLEHEIGQGGFSVVYLAYQFDKPAAKDNKFAIKCIEKKVA